jgi:uracil-DNA glycosylase
MKPLIIGEAPSKNEVTEHPIEGRIGRRLAACAGLTLPEFLAHFDRVNLLHVRQDTKEKGFEFDAAAARKAATLLKPSFKRGQTVLLLGGRVAEAFGIHDAYFTWHVVNGARLYIVPHPSGVNRWWNDPINKLCAEQFMQAIVRNSHA